MINKNCEFCGLAFQAKLNKQQFCSQQCVGQSQRKQTVLSCVHCKTEYSVNSYRKELSRFCSQKCKGLLEAGIIFGSESQKQCAKCHKVKNISDFAKATNKPIGVLGRCNDCNKEWHSNHRANNRKKYNSYSRVHYYKHHEKSKEWARNERNSLRNEIVIAYGSFCALCGETETKFLALDHIFSDGYLDRKQFGSSGNIYRNVKKQGFPKDRYQLLCHNCNGAKARMGYKAKDLKRKAERDSVRNELFIQYGNECVCCKETEKSFLTIDHIYNDGQLDKPVGRGGCKLYDFLRRNNYPKDRYQLLCYNCNFAKAFYGKCPHKSLM